jgi:hypothetical protein
MSYVTYSPATKSEFETPTDFSSLSKLNLITILLHKLLIVTRRGCGLMRGSGSMRGKGASGWEATRQPAKQERLKERQSWQTGGYATTSHIRGVQQEADA